MRRQENSNKFKLGHKKFSSDLDQPFLPNIFIPTSKTFNDNFQKQLIESGFKTVLLSNSQCTHEKTFAYILLVLCFQNQNGEQNGFINSLLQLIQTPQFQITLPQYSDKLSQYSHQEMKSVLKQYINYKNSRKQFDIMQTFRRQPLVLQIFGFLFQTLLTLGDIYKDECYIAQTFSIYEFLSTYFQVQFMIADNYLIFSSANVYIMKEEKNQFYMFYLPSIQNLKISRQKNPHQQNNKISTEASESSEVRLQQNQIDARKIKKFLSKLKKNKQCSNRISIQNYPFDQQFLSPSKYVMEDNVVEQIQHIQRDLELYNQRQSYATLLKGNEKTRKGSNYRTKSQAFESNQQKYPKNEINISKNKQFFPQFQKNKQFLDVPIFYRPPLTSRTPPQIFIQNTKNADININITKQFTSSFLLQKMPEPYRTSIKMKKQKARRLRRSANHPLLI